MLENPAQAYNLRGQTATRTLARNVTTTYGYDGATGELTSQTYTDSTPAIGYSYGRTGQVETITDTTGTRDLVYDVVYRPWRLTAEAESAFYGGRVVTRLYDDTTTGFIGRVKGFKVGAAVGSDSDLAQTFGFTTIGRLWTVTTARQADSSTARTFRYGYRGDSALLESLAIDQNGGPGGHPFTITRSYEDTRDVITDVVTKWIDVVRTSYHYEVDARGLRSKVVQSGDAFSDYGDVTSQQFYYNGRGELTGAVGYMGSDTTISNKQLKGRRYGYGYDNAGNRKWSDRTGVDLDNDGLPDLRDDYTTNVLNQYTDRENNALPVSGTAEVDNGGANGVAVAIQGGTLGPIAASRQGRYWNSEIVVNNNYGTTPTTPSSTTKNPWRGTLTIFTAKRGSSGSADLYRADARLAEIAPAFQKFTYDDDGNLTSDGIADYTWDAENRLVRMETTTLAQNWGFPHRELTFRYDYMGRRIQKRVMEEMSTNNWSEITSRRFLYDGWNVIAEYLAPGGTTCGALVRSYTWGLDIALSQTDAGGVGALLQIADHATGKSYLPTYDGNGNVAALFNAAASSSSTALAAVYEYSPYGEPLRAQVLDSTIADNPFRFSTKWTDLETGAVYYGYRYYDPKNGRFINKDPIEETGGLNLYGFCGNNAINRWDLLGHTVTATDYGTFFAQSTDRWGNYGEWNFSSEADAENWAAAWVMHDMSVVGDRDVTDTYLFPDTPIDIKSSNYDTRFANAWTFTRAQGYNPDDGIFETYLQQNYDNFYGSQETQGAGSSGVSTKSILDAMFGSAYRTPADSAGVGGGDGGSAFAGGWSYFSLTFATQRLAAIATNANSPRSATNLLGIVYVNHPVGQGFDHSLLVITPHNQDAYLTNPLFQRVDANGKHYATLGAGPDTLLSVYGPMVASPNRPTDVSGARNNQMAISIPSIYANEDAAISALFSLTDTYNSQKVSYTLLPQGPNQYNSNSFISGLLNAGYFSAPQPGGLPIGWSYPVPVSRFRSP